MRVHYLQHVFFENPGHIGSFLKKRNHAISSTLFFENDYQLPNMDEFDALIVMGGSMGADDESAFPWLKEEKLFIKKCIEEGKKVLGICLGAQLIARCLGATVNPASNKEIGWYKLMTTETCKKTKWLHQLFLDNPIVFHWHGDKFELPTGTRGDLLISEANNHQILYYNEQVIGLQFHLEVTEESLNLMLEHASNDLASGKYIQNKQTILQGKQYIEHCNQLMDAVLIHWLSVFGK